MTEQGPARISVKTELTVLEATPGAPISFTVMQYEGSAIYKPPEDTVLSSEDDLTDEYRVTDRTGLVEGDEILVPTLFGWSWATVEKFHPKRGYYATNGTSGFPLEWCNQRHCWVCAGSINLRGVKRLQLFK